jgi:hypothetical protein
MDTTEVLHPLQITPFQTRRHTQSGRLPFLDQIPVEWG